MSSLSSEVVLFCNEGIALIAQFMLIYGNYLFCNLSCFSLSISFCFIPFIYYCFTCRTRLRWGPRGDRGKGGECREPFSSSWVENSLMGPFLQSLNYWCVKLSLCTFPLGGCRKCKRPITFSESWGVCLTSTNWQASLKSSYILDFFDYFSLWRIWW